MRMNKIISSISTLSSVVFLAYTLYNVKKKIENKPEQMINFSLLNILIIALVFFVFLPASWFSLNYLLLACLEQTLGFSLILSLTCLSVLNIVLLIAFLAIFIKIKNKVAEKGESMLSSLMSKLL